MPLTSSKYHSLTLTAIITVLVMILSSCAHDEENVPGENNIFQIKFNICTITPYTRADYDTSPDAWTELEGSGSENFLNLSDLKYLIFDSDKNFICDVSAEARTLAKNTGYTLYEVTASVNDPYFYTHLDDIVDFYILVCANLSDWGITFPTIRVGDSLEDIFTQNMVMTTIPDASLLKEAANYSMDGCQYFPMVGLQRFTIPGSMLRLAEGVPFDITNSTGKSVDLLRALAKIEVVDRINIAPDAIFNANTDGGSPLRIANVELYGYMSEGTALPSLDKWTDPTGQIYSTQVDNVTLPAGKNPTILYHLPPALNNDLTIDNAGGSTEPYSIELQYDAVATARRDDKCPVYSGYIFEYSKISLTSQGISTDQLPYFAVRIRGGETGSEFGAADNEPIQYYMRMASYTNGIANVGDNLPRLIRNYIYRFEITGLGDNLGINWDICPMQPAQADIIFN